MSRPPDLSRAQAASEILAGSGEMGELVRVHDWSNTPLGPIEGWPQSLKTAVRIALCSRYPMFVWWGPELINIYNDAYVPVLGERHPRALGLSAPDIWAEIWDVVGPQSEAVLRHGQATWNESVLLVMERHGFTEETYFTFSYSPVPTESGEIGGLFCACTEETQRVLGERRLRILRDLGERSLASLKSPEKICRVAAETLATNPHDFPFALVYLLDDDGEEARLHGAAFLEAGSAAAPPTVRVGGDEDRWDFGSAVAVGRGVLIEDLDSRLPALPAGPWSDDSTRRAFVMPLSRAGQRDLPAGFLVAGLSPRLAFDADYRSFLELSAGQLATALANARSYAEERKRAAALAELDRAKTEFFSNVSHEFRTPLTLMLGPLQDLMADGALPAEMRGPLELVYRNAERLLKLVNALLDFSRIEAGRIEATYVPTDLALLTSELASVFRAAVESAGLALEVDCPSLPEPVYVDREMWEKIVLNLLSNAFKFTRQGKIGVCLRTADDAVEVRVSDTGAGIPAEELPRLFERFHRVKVAEARSFEGSGIGLALVQELVRLHGGTVEVTSEVGLGSVFTVRIPCGKGHLPAEHVEPASSPTPLHVTAGAYVEEAMRWLPGEGEAAAEAEAAERDTERASILLADDNADMRSYVRRLLGERYRVVAVADGRQALEALHEGSFDLVLSDVMMPGLDGFGLLAALRADESTRSLPVILLSARAGEESRVEGLGAGADDYLVKPFSARELTARVEAHLELQRERRSTLKALEEADRRKDEFLALLAHELRNPLAPIRSAAEVLKLAGEENDKQRWAREVIERQARHLSRLVDDLLDVSRITSGKVELERETLDLETVLHQAVETSRPAIDQRRHELTLSLPAEPIRLEGDRVRLVQVFGNLLNNAAKYNEERGRIELAASEEGGQAVVRVRDDGIGLAPDVLPHVFDLFTQADATLDRSQGGLGIGLTLARQLVELHGGSIEARSEGVGKGCELVVRLPALAPTDAEEAGSGEGAEDGRAGRRSRILVVEDNVDTAESMRMLLELEGHEARAVYRGAEALEVARSFRPDVVLCDIGLPGMSGYEVAEQLRRERPSGELLLVALTGYGHEGARSRSRQAGFDEHLVKPFEPAAFAALLEQLHSD